MGVGGGGGGAETCGIGYIRRRWVDSLCFMREMDEEGSGGVGALCA